MEILPLSVRGTTPVIMWFFTLKTNVDLSASLGNKAPMDAGKITFLLRES